MADEISVADDLKRCLERTEWTETGICGFLIGRVWRGHVNVLNVWTVKQAEVDTLLAELTSCQRHLSGGLDIVGVVAAVKSPTQTSEVKDQLNTLPLEFQTTLPAHKLMVCIVQQKSENGRAAFYQWMAEDRKLEAVSVKIVVEGFDAEQVIFRLQAKIPLKLQLDNRSSDPETWEDKISKAFANLDAGVVADSYVYGFRDTNIFLSENTLAAVKKKMSTVRKLHDAIVDDTNSHGRKKRSLAGQQPPVSVDVYQQVSGSTDHFAQPTCAPAVHQRSGSFKFLQMTLPLDVIVEVDVQEKTGTLLELMKCAVRTQLQAMQQCLEQHHSKENEFYTPEPFHFNIPHRHTCVTVVYPRNVPDVQLESRRQYLHNRMCLGLKNPLFRRANARLFPGQRAMGGYIINPHLGLPASGVQGGTPHLVHGNYSYHHYMQDHFDDNKWGCAYRSLQTLVSWFAFQGFTDVEVPSHRTIQQALVAVGDKEANFVGSKKWIGSFEVSYCLDHLLGVSSKFLNVSEGAELASKGRELAQHFDTMGTPIMIGGGVLAHTILGIDYSESSGEIKFLILDPHYTGGEDIQTIQREGWCGWKDSSFWNPTAHYNLCMPMRPECF